MAKADECVVIDDSDLGDDEPGPSRLIHKPRACQIEREWFDQEYQKPIRQVQDCTIRSEVICQYQDLIWNKPHDRMVPGYGLTPRELACVTSDGRKGWLVSSHFFWLSRCLNQMGDEAKCFVYDPQLRQEAVEKLFPFNCRNKLKTLILVMCVGRQDDGIVFFGTDKIQGDHWSVSVIDLRDGTVYYCDTLGWPAPFDLCSGIIRYTRILSLVHVKQLKVEMSHSSNSEQHTCTHECTNYPLQTCSDVCGVVVMICTAIAALDRTLFKLLMKPVNKDLNLYLTDPTEYSTYLRYVLLTWLASNTIDMSLISLKAGFDPNRIPTPRALAKCVPLKRKPLFIDQEPTESRNKTFKVEKKSDPFSSFILKASKECFNSEQILNKVTEFYDLNERKMTKVPLLEICKDLSFNNAIERCQDANMSMNGYFKEFNRRTDNPVILYQNPMTRKINESATTEFILVLQTPFQKDLLKNHSKPCVSITNCSKFNDGLPYYLFTVSVFFDGIYEVPAAFILTENFASEVMHKAFLALRNNCGNIQTDILISDIKGEIYKQWTAVFSKQSKRMFHPWDVHQMWVSRMKNWVPDIEIRRRMNAYLYNIRYITDKDAFETYTDELLSYISSRSISFANYLKEKFISDNKSHYWATCYRTIPYSQTIPFLIQYLDILKSLQFFAEGAMNRIDVMFHKLLQLSMFLQRRLIAISSQTKQDAAIRNIRTLHDQSNGGNFDFYRSVSGDEWCIRASDENNALTLFDAGNEDCDCSLRCEKCDICIHRYICSCADYLLRMEGCKHIHFLHSMKKLDSFIDNFSGANTSSTHQVKERGDGSESHHSDNNGCLNSDVAHLKKLVQKEMMKLSSKIHASNSHQLLRCVLNNLQDIEFPVSTK